MKAMKRQKWKRRGSTIGKTECQKVLLHVRTTGHDATMMNANGAPGIASTT